MLAQPLLISRKDRALRPKMCEELAKLTGQPVQQVLWDSSGLSDVKFFALYEDLSRRYGLTDWRQWA